MTIKNKIHNTTSQSQVITPSLGQQASRGITVFFIQSIGTKILSFLGQIILAWLLVPDDFGVVSLVLTVSSLIAALQFGSVRDWLMLKSKNFTDWSAPAFWFSTVTGLGSLLLTISVAHVSGWYFNDPRIVPLIYLVAIQNVCNSLGVVSSTRIELNLQFNLLAIMGTAFTTLTLVLTLILAMAKFGPLSMILPLTIVSLLRLMVYLYLAPPKIRWAPRLSVFLCIAQSGLLLGIANFAYVVINWADYFILGRMFQDKSLVGGYYWAFALSSQTNQMIGLNVAGVLQPALCKIDNNPHRQIEAFIRVTRILAFISFPLAFLQAIIAGPGVKIVFASKWYPSIVLLEILCLASAPQVVGASFYALLRAQGRFLLYLYITIIHAIFFILSVFLGAYYGGTTGAALGVLIFAYIAYPSAIYITIKSFHKSAFYTVFKAFIWPLTISVIAASIAYNCTFFIPSTTKMMLLTMLLIRTIIMIALYLIFLRLLRPLDWTEIMSQIRIYLFKKT